jgi:AcrR family transcriptional regulator
VRTSSRLPAEQRREAILQAVRSLFAEKGFHGTTTRELAEAAGVSEALLFKHFPTKEALYSAMHTPCGNPQTHAEMQRLLELEPSTSTLVHLVHYLVMRLVGPPRPGAPEDDRIMHRLMLRSLMEDGEFARLILKQVVAPWIGKIEECIQAAIDAGDAVENPATPKLRSWFVQHLAVMVMIHLRPSTPTIEYGVTRDRLVEQVVWFALRGAGLKDAEIKRHYNPKAMTMFSR